MNLLRQTKNALIRLRRDGLFRTLQYSSEQASERFHEWRLGISSTGKKSLQELGIHNSHSCHYYPSDYRSIYKAFRHLSIRPDKDVFLDFGSGMGRVVVVASTFPFLRVTGIELSPELCTIARNNIERACTRLRCQNVEIITADATSFAIPLDTTIIFFYNPFRGPVLTSVLNNIHESLTQAPRDLWIVFKNPDDLKSHPELDSWLTKLHEFPASDADHSIMILKNRH